MTETPSELAIRLRRARFNQALATADLAAIGSLLTNNVVLVAGTDSALLSGRNAQLLAWKREFASSDPVIYLRSPETITVSSIAPTAFDRGYGAVQIRAVSCWRAGFTPRSGGGSAPIG